MSDRWGIDLWVKRDDLIPECLGGNKVRKTSRIINAFQKLPDVLITNGGAESNHARVVALMAAQAGRSVHLVLHGEPSCQRGNGFMCQLAGAHIHHVQSDEIANTISMLHARELARGRTVGVIPGGGHSVAGADAYSDAVAELPFAPDHIVTASGTGATQAGLIIGTRRHRLRSKVIGVSVARDARRGHQEIAGLLSDELHGDVHFDDRFTFGGYERSTDELNGFIAEVLKAEGLPLDPTYTGKAMFGLMRMVETAEIKVGSRVVFWHTGGLLNLLSMRSAET